MREAELSAWRIQMTVSVGAGLQSTAGDCDHVHVQAGARPLEEVATSSSPIGRRRG